MLKLKAVTQSTVCAVPKSLQEVEVALVVLMVEFCWIMWCYRNVVRLTDRLLLADEHGHTHTHPAGHSVLTPCSLRLKNHNISIAFFFFLTVYEYLYGNFWLNQWIWCWRVTWLRYSLCSSLWWWCSYIKHNS